MWCARDAKWPHVCAPPIPRLGGGVQVGVAARTGSYLLAVMHNNRIETRFKCLILLWSHYN